MLTDDILGMSSKPEKIEFVDIAVSDLHVIDKNKKFNTILGMNFEMGNEGKRYVRVVYNFK